MTLAPWDDLVALSLIGTERREAQAPVMPGALGDALGALDWSEPERAVLGAAAMLSGAKAAGLNPRQMEAPEPAPPATGRRCTPGARLVIERLLGGAERGLLPEALERFVAVGMALPDVLLADLLDAATSDRPLRSRLVRAGGDRLAWFAAHDERWHWATGAGDPADVWGTGTRVERAAVLAEVRASDPAAARALVESTWDSDAPEDRRAFLDVLSEGLSLDDEPLLERALDDRRKPVRMSAAGLLAGLPGSALRERMADRLRPLIAVSGGRRPQLEIQAPEEIDKAGRRDGVEDANAPPGFGPRAWWLAQIIRAAPLTVWEERTQLPPVRILELVRNSEYARPVFDGLSDATGHERSPEWAVAWVSLSAEQALFIIGRAPGPWDVELSRAFLDRLRRIGQPIGSVSYHHVLEPLAERLHPDTVEEALPVVEAVWPPPQFDARSLLTLRRAISQEIR